MTSVASYVAETVDSTFEINSANNATWYTDPTLYNTGILSYYIFLLFY